MLWKTIKERVHFTGKKIRGLIGDHGDGLAAAKAIAIIDFDYGWDTHILLLRDCDKQPERYKALKSIREKYPNRSIIIGFAIDHIEAWILAAFVPDCEKEKTALENEKKNLGFDPTCKPDKLTASEDGTKSNPKRVLEILMAERGNNRAVYAEMMKEMKWEHLEDGVNCGIVPFCREIREKLVPHFKKEG